MPSLWERFNAWLCQKFGHKPWREAMTEAEICRRCNRLLSTRYERERKAKEPPHDA